MAVQRPEMPAPMITTDAVVKVSLRMVAMM